MMSASLSKVSENAYALKGDITHQSVLALISDGAKQFAALKGGAVTVDLSALNNPNTVSVALMLVWKRDLKKRSISITYTGIPATLLSVMTMSNVNDLMGVV